MSGANMGTETSKPILEMGELMLDESNSIHNHTERRWETYIVSNTLGIVGSSSGATQEESFSIAGFFADAWNNRHASESVNADLLAACKEAMHATMLNPESCQDEINESREIIAAAIAKAEKGKP